MRFIGDCHGKIEQLLVKLATMGESGHILQIGDMGIGFRGVELPRLHETFGFIRGNHDSPSLCRQHPNYARDFGIWNGVFVVAGAYSIDWECRTPGKSWWFGEELDSKDQEAAYELYVQEKPRVVATHECPRLVGEAILKDKGFRPEKWGSTESSTALLLQRMFEAHQPEDWVFGHYHRDWDAKIDGTRFKCLNELSTARV